MFWQLFTYLKVFRFTSNSNFRFSERSVKLAINMYISIHTIFTIKFTVTFWVRLHLDANFPISNATVVSGVTHRAARTSATSVSPPRLRGVTMEWTLVTAFDERKAVVWQHTKQKEGQKELQMEVWSFGGKFASFLSFSCWIWGFAVAWITQWDTHLTTIGRERESSDAVL